MHIKIYFDEKPVFLCTELNEELKQLIHHPDTVFIDEISTPAINSLLHEIKKEDFHAGIILGNDMAALKKAFSRHFTAVQAAGGVVQNDKKELLFIYRLNKWDLPKGKIEKDETPDSAAIREIQEETGAIGLHQKKKIGETYHTYNAFGKSFFKTTHWFYFTTDKEQSLHPQLEENITMIKWFKTGDIKTVMENTYASIKDVMVAFFDEP